MRHKLQTNMMDVSVIIIVVAFASLAATAPAVVGNGIDINAPQTYASASIVGNQVYMFSQLPSNSVMPVLLYQNGSVSCQFASYVPCNSSMVVTSRATNLTVIAYCSTVQVVEAGTCNVLWTYQNSSYQFNSQSRSKFTGDSAVFTGELLALPCYASSDVDQQFHMLCLLKATLAASPVLLDTFFVGSFLSPLSTFASNSQSVGAAYPGAQNTTTLVVATLIGTILQYQFSSYVAPANASLLAFGYGALTTATPQIVPLTNTTAIQSMLLQQFTVSTSGPPTVNVTAFARVQLTAVSTSDCGVDFTTSYMILSCQHYFMNVYLRTQMTPVMQLTVEDLPSCSDLSVVAASDTLLVLSCRYTTVFVPVVCGLGSYGTPPNCSLCPPGTFNAVRGEPSVASCVPCHIGTTSSNWGSSTCAPCAAGTRAQMLSSTLWGCTSCDAGEVSAAGSAVCSHCPLGFHPSPSSDSCVDCPAGTYGTINGLCANCPNGTWSNVLQAQSSTVCQPCPAGTFSSTPSSFLGCQPCATGFYNDRGGQAACLPCPAGMFCPSGGRLPLSSAILGNFSGLGHPNWCDQLADTTAEGNKQLITYLLVAAAGVVVLLVLILLMVYTCPTPSQRLQRAFVMVDLHSVKHSTPEGSPVVRNSTCHGGFITFALVLGVAILVSWLAAQFVLYNHAVDITLISSTLNTPSTNMTAELQLYGYGDACSAPNIVVASGIVGNASSNVIVNSTSGLCTVTWNCTKCQFDDFPHISFNFNESYAFANAIGFSVTLPKVISCKETWQTPCPPNTVQGILVSSNKTQLIGASSNGMLFSGGKAATIYIAYVDTQYQESQLTQNPSRGSELFNSSVSEFTVVNSAQFVPGTPLGIVISFNTFTGSQLISLKPILTLQAFATQVLSLSTSLLGSGAIVLVVFEALVERWKQRRGRIPVSEAVRTSRNWGSKPGGMINSVADQGATAMSEPLL
eukprot:TRINITY_DN9766_c0_g1_i1.p1 TRINITY_DN9766_c0_g1~~TRINITY_DN9766_c0_g1_i1.p1  ORF type:complete len:964 (+),score=115.79 TRINITY_DN9766_c0_g1_i1:1-2892(+)